MLRGFFGAPEGTIAMVQRQVWHTARSKEGRDSHLQHVDVIVGAAGVMRGRTARRAGGGPAVRLARALPGGAAVARAAQRVRRACLRSWWLGRRDLDELAVQSGLDKPMHVAVARIVPDLHRAIVICTFVRLFRARHGRNHVGRLASHGRVSWARTLPVSTSSE